MRAGGDGISALISRPRPRPVTASAHPPTLSVDKNWPLHSIIVAQRGEARPVILRASTARTPQALAPLFSSSRTQHGMQPLIHILPECGGGLGCRRLVTEADARTLERQLLPRCYVA